MKTNLSFVIALLLLAICGISCSQKDMHDNQYGNHRDSGVVLSDGVILKSGVVFFSADNQKYVSVLDTNKISVTADVPSLLRITKGSIVLVELSDKNPLGFAGKVVSEGQEPDGNIYYTESVSLEDIFEELSIDTEVDVFKDADTIVDENGNICEIYSVDADEIEQAEEVEQSDTKGNTDRTIPVYKRIPIHGNGFDGDLVISSSVHVMVNVSKGKIREYDISLERQTYIRSHIGIQISGSHELTLLPELNLKIPVGIPICPGVVLQPMISTSVKAKAEGELKLQSDAYMRFEDTSIRFHDGEYTNNSNTNVVFKMSPAYLDCNGSLELIPRVALKLDAWGMNLLGFGVDASGSMMFKLNKTMRMSYKNQIAKEAKATVVAGGSLGIFLYANLLEGKDIRASISIPSTTYIIDLLDKGKNHKIEKEVGNWSINGEFDDDTFMSIDDRGLALFRAGDDEPVFTVSMVDNLSSPKNRRSIQDKSVAVSGNPLQYYIRPYNQIIVEGQKYFFYGKPIGAFVKAIRVTYTSNYSCTLDFDYDEYGRLKSAGTLKYSYGDSSVSISGSTLGFPYADTGGDQWNWYVSFDSDGGIQGGTVNNSGGVMTISPGYSLATLQDASCHYVRFTYNNGNLTHMLEHGEHPRNDGEIFIFNHDYSFSYGDRPNPSEVIDIVNYSLGNHGWLFPPFIVLAETTNRLLPTGYTFTDHGLTNDHCSLNYNMDEKGRISSFSTLYMSGSVYYYDEFPYEED